MILLFLPLPDSQQDLTQIFVVRIWWISWNWGGCSPVPSVLRSFHSSSSPHSSSSNLSKVPLLVFLPVWFQSLLQVSKFTSVSLWTFLKFQTLGWWFVLQPQFFDRSKKSYWFFGWNWPVQFSWKDGSDHFQVPVRAKIRKLFQNVYEKAQFVE